MSMELEKVSEIEQAIGVLKKCANGNGEVIDTLSRSVEELKKFYATEAGIAELKKVVKFDEGIESRLQGNFEIVDLLNRSVVELQKYFPADTEYFLRRTYDLDPNSNCLSLDIWTNYGVKQAHITMDKFDDWWLDNIPGEYDTELLVGVRYA